MAPTPRPSLIVASIPAFIVALGQAIAVGAGGGPAPEATQAAPRAPGVEQPHFDDAVIPLGQPFVLGLGETALVEDELVVTFTGVREDSRCPADVQCVWEGNAQVAVDVALRGRDQVTLVLDTNPGFATDRIYGAYTIGLVDLEPYPRTDAPADVPCRVTLRVDPADDQPTRSPR